MINKLKEYLSKSVTSYHSIKNTINILKENNFIELKENEKWNLEKNKGYYICRASSSLIAFKTNELCQNSYGFNIVASHTDSPCLKIKNKSEMRVNKYSKLNVEVYGGPLLYTWLDKPLKIGGRVICKNKQTQLLESILITPNTTIVIPSLAIHMNRGVNDGLKLNPQIDLSPLTGLDLTQDSLDIVLNKYIDTSIYELLDYDLYLYNATENYFAGVNNEFLCSPRIDNLTSVHSSMVALLGANGNRINMAVMLDNEEVGSQTKQGAGGKFLIDTIERINYSLGYQKLDLDIALSNSFIVSLDNAHALHPNHQELNDPTNKVIMGDGIVIKHHANQNYTTDAFSSSIFKEILVRNNIKFQDFFMKSDMRCGSTLGAISSTQLSIKSVDIGLAQLAMHSNMETMAVADYNELVEGLKVFYETDINFVGYDKVKL